MISHFFESTFNMAPFSQKEENKASGIINTFGTILIVSLIFISFERVLLEKSNIVAETLCAVIFLILSLVINKQGKANLAANLMIYPITALIVYDAVIHYGIHDASLFGIPGLLIIAGLISSRFSFYIYAVLCLMVIISMGVLEIRGVLINKFSYLTETGDIFLMSTIIMITTFAIRIFSEHLLRSLEAARYNAKTIKASEQGMRALIFALPDMVVRMTSKGDIKEFSAPGSLMMTIDSGEMIGKNVAELNNDEVTEKTMNAIKNCIGKNTVEQFEYRITRNNKAMDWEARFVSIDGKDVLGVIRDISERKRTEEALKLSEEIFKAFMEYSPIYVFFKDKDIRAVKLSKNYEQMLGMPMPQLLGKNMFELFPSELAKSMILDDQNILRQGKLIKVQEELEGRVYETIKFPIFMKGEPEYLAGFTIDITDTKKNEQRLKEYAGELKEANNAKEKFFSIIAHDLRSPFLGILGSIEMLTADYNELTDEERKQMIGRVGTAIRRTFELLENLLHWSRVQSGKMIPTAVELNVKTEILQVIALLKDFARNKNIELNYLLNDKYNAVIDKDMLKTIMRNLISNAIKFSVPGGKINITDEEGENEIIVKVADNGIGMDDETLRNLFKIGGSQSRMGTNNEAGTGLGLLVCKEMIELNKGKIWVQSREREGSSFYISIAKAR